MSEKPKSRQASWVVLAMFLTPCLGSCGGGGISGITPLKLVSAAFSPNPIPTPSAGVPASFEIRWQVKNNGYNMKVGTSAGIFLQAGCLDCNNQLVTIACTSSIAPADSNARELNCSSNDPQVALQTYVRTYPVGVTNWNFYAYILGSGLGLSGEYDQANVSVELQ